MTYKIEGQILSLDDIQNILDGGLEIQFAPSVVDQINAGRTFLDDKLKDSDASYYGINTGFGSLYNIRISKSALQALQSNLIKSHSSGLGAEIQENLSRMILLLKILSLARGFSGIRWVLLERLVGMYNRKIHPVMYTFGSLGASGDLAPLAHMSLPLLGEGEVFMNGERMDGKDALAREKWSPLTLSSKEGLALINGTQFTTGITLWSYFEARKIWSCANFIAAVSIDAFDGCIDPFDPLIQSVRPHAGQVESARQVWDLLSDSEIIRREKAHVQDPYAFRCVPQVHGASYQAISHAGEILETEVNSVTDNPIVFKDADEILSGGNFHAQPIALIADYMAIALSEIGSISERRTYQLVSGKRGLPDYLIQDPGIHSGFMITQYTAASIVNRNKILCTPASVDSIISSKGQEDHVSMGANAATKLKEVTENVWDILAIEFLAAMQALEFRLPTRSGSKIEAIRSKFREEVSFVTEDRIIHHDLVKAKDFIRNLKFQESMSG